MTTTNDSEAEAIRVRRALAQVDAGDPVIGLALSGGGLRSATFCLGVIRALAKNGILHRFDYLSTVSGGGYIGSALGRLYGQSAAEAASDEAPPPAREVERGVASDSSVFLWWLRNNGRFLAPAGANDLLQTWASHLRGFIATQVEVAVLATLVACAIVLPHLAYALHAFFVDDAVETASVATWAVSLWWWLLPLPAAIALVLAYAYWFLGKATLAGLGTAVLAGALGLALYSHGCTWPPSLESALVGLGAIALLPSPVAWCCARLSGLRRSAAANRVRYTTGLVRCMKATGVIFALGALDMLSWYMKEWLNIGVDANAGGSMVTGVGMTTFLIGVARFALPAMQSAGRTGVSRLPWMAIAHVAGLVLLVAIVLFWTTVYQILVFPGGTSVFDGVLASSYVRWALVSVVGIVYLLLNGRSLEQLNQSSLHLFYRSRIARAYVSVGNVGNATGQGDARFPTSTLAANTREITEAIAKVTRLLDGDDTPMTEYAPHRHGGPIHLVNCCINQTVDDRTGTFNADRHGVGLTVSALGIETGTHLPAPGSATHLAGTTLAEWVAISGAAVGSGMGSQTRSGVAALIFLTGLRLGYWQANLEGNATRKAGAVAKYAAMLREMLARFPGLGAPNWYLSDGGHFDNTGIYALLKRKLSLMVLVDCGADPDYRFADMENLIRKARIDYDATIEFVDPAGLIPLAGPNACLFGSPTTVCALSGPEHLLLARVTYADGAQGTLVVIKPRVSTEMPLDIAGYADRDASFPQQATTQLFYSEAQWESYNELGMLLGSSLTTPLFGSLSTWAWTAPVLGTNAAMLTPTVTPPSRAQRIATTVGTSIGVGALLTALLAGWQAWDTHREQQVQIAASTLAEARRVNTQAAALLADVSEAADRGEGYTREMNAHVGAFTSDIGGMALSDYQRTAYRDLLDPLDTICSATDDDALAAACQDQENQLAASTDDPVSGWSQAMNDYRRWRDNTLALEATKSATAVVLPTDVIDDMTAMTEDSPAVPATATGGGQPGSPVRAAPPAASPARPGLSPTARVTALHDAAAKACHRTTLPFTLYAQIYADNQRGQVMASLAPVRELGIIVPGVENVADTAGRSGKRGPIEWKSPTLLYPPEGAACGTALVAWANAALPTLHGRARAVPMPLGTGKSNVLELWVPRGASAP